MTSSTDGEGRTTRYEYNRAGKISAIVDPTGEKETYHYDPLNQLKKVEYPSYTEELFYDKAGNRTRRMAQGVEELYQYAPETA